MSSAVTPGVTSPSPPVTGAGRPVLRAVNVDLDDDALGYQDRQAKPEALVVPLRRTAPAGPAKNKPPKKEWATDRFSAVDQHAMDLMHLAFIKAFAIERRDTSASAAPAGSGAAWPFPTVADPTDYGEAEMVKGADGVERLKHKPPPVKPAPPNSAEIQFRDDVELLLLKLADIDRWGAKLVAARAARVSWEALVARDIMCRTRMQQHRLRLKALHRLVVFDRAMGLGVTGRVLAV